MCVLPLGRRHLFGEDLNHCFGTCLLSDLGTCACDVTYNFCDVANFCTCDPDCSAAQLALAPASASASPSTSLMTYLTNPPSALSVHSQDSAFELNALRSSSFSSLDCCPIACFSQEPTRDCDLRRFPTACSLTCSAPTCAVTCQ